jgi:DNA-binding CsgD family transcriptional regulator
MYWEMVLVEVLNKENPGQEYFFTNIKAYCNTRISGMVREAPVRPRRYKRHARKYSLGKSYPTIYFTEREAQTIFYFLYGRSAMEVADILSLSRRTIEFYVRNMKTKLDCRRKSELICKVRESEFMVNFDLSCLHDD